MTSEDAGDRGAVGGTLCRSRVSPQGWFPGVWELSPGPGEVGTGPGGVEWVSSILVALVGAVARAPGALVITLLAEGEESKKGLGRPSGLQH